MSVETRRTMDSPVGRLLLRADEEGLLQIAFHAKENCMDDAPILMQAQRELEEYFAGRRRTFSVPLSMRGTAFQMRVWRVLCTIGYGETMTYGAVAACAGNARAARAVGMTCNKNPIPIIVPCHRVVGAGGNLTGYAGGLDVKQILLKLEGVETQACQNSKAQ